MDVEGVGSDETGSGNTGSDETVSDKTDSDAEGFGGVGRANNIAPQLTQNAASGRFSVLHLGQITMVISSARRIYHLRIR
jgi:hypothetical protein